MESVGLLGTGELFAGRYRVGMQIGKGGMGRVYLAEDMRLNGKQVALKLTKPLPEERDAFVSEARLMCGLSHPHLPAIVDYYPPDADGLACIVMDYIAGDTLAERFERFGLRLPFRLVLKYLIQLCDVLAYLHAQSPPIVFRDLKPSNVLIDRNDQAVLVDFGIARRFRPGETSDTLQLGTPGFAAPEQLRGEQSDSRTDLYALGALAYFLLSGGRFAMRHSGSMRSALQGDVPGTFIVQLERLLSSDLNKRPQSAGQLREELMIIGPQVGKDYRPAETPYPGNSELSQGEESVIVVAVASAYPGGGATFTAHAASAALNRAGLSHALVECPGIIEDAELYTLLDGEKRMPKVAVFADASGIQPSAPAWREGSAAYYPIDPSNQSAGQEPGSAFSQWLRKLGVPIVLLDVSSRWTDAKTQDWLRDTADRIWMVADCLPTKWTRLRQQACISLQAAGGKEGRRQVAFDWIANRDQSFPGRKAWLELFPAMPAALVPQVDSGAMLAALWRGQGLSEDRSIAQPLDASLKRLLVALVKSIG
ncbi:serine/threonine-protein kinase [Cohnella panacarvi]|uniref:serine/threonine-protein kinase n=1 Tax=Cohnella panacarvi TaxID=400776 RepID=UPI00047AC3EF|nr:serine/threonine-protein kinase [Cohnella panacarvi]